MRMIQSCVLTRNVVECWGSSVTSDRSRDYGHVRDLSLSLLILTQKWSRGLGQKCGQSQTKLLFQTCFDIFLGLHLDTRRRIRNFSLNRDRPRLSWELSQSWGQNYVPCHPLWLVPASCWDNNPLDDDVSVCPSHSILSLIPLMGTNWRHKKWSQKREPFRHLYIR